MISVEHQPRQAGVASRSRVRALVLGLCIAACDSAANEARREIAQSPSDEKRMAASSLDVEFILRDLKGGLVAQTTVRAGAQSAFSVRNCDGIGLPGLLRAAGYTVSQSEVQSGHDVSNYVVRFTGRNLIGDVWALKRDDCTTMDFRLQLAHNAAAWRVRGRQAQDRIACRHEGVEGAERRVLDILAPCWFHDHTGFPAETRESLQQSPK